MASGWFEFTVAEWEAFRDQIDEYIVKLDPTLADTVTLRLQHDTQRHLWFTRSDSGRLYPLVGPVA